jgi:hypothetical protein
MVMKWLLLRTCGCRVLTNYGQATGVLFSIVYVTWLSMCRLKSVGEKVSSDPTITVPEVRIMKSRSVKSRHYISHQQRFLCFDRSSIAGVILLCCLMILLSACTSPFFTPSQSGYNETPTLTNSPTPVVSPTPTVKPPTITLQVVGCPTLSINWDSLIGTHANVNKVQKVTCGNLEGNGSVQALVNVRYYTPDAKLDFYVYDNLSGAPTQRFKVQGLIDGDTNISPTGTITTAEIGISGLSSAVPDLFKEYKWNGTTFGQILFPGLYPDVTHYQAEKSQALYIAQGGASGNESWRTSGVLVAEHLALSVFRWPNVTKTVVKNNLVDPIIVQVTNNEPGGGGFLATLYHLDGVSTNILEITNVTSTNGSVSLTHPTVGTQVSSPVSVQGTYVASGSILGRVVLYDNTYVTVGDTGALRSSLTTGSASFSVAIPYTLNARGVQEGVIAFFSTIQNNTAFINQAVMMKVFLSA